MGADYSLKFFDQLIQELYQSPTHSNHFQPFLNILVEAFQLSDAILHIESDQLDATELRSVWISGPTSNAILDGIELDLLELNYFGKFMLEQPYEHVYGWLLHQGRYPDSYDNYRYKPIHDWFDSHNFVDIIGCVIPFPHCRVFFHGHRQKHVGAFTQQDIAALELLLPHIKQSFNLYFHLKSALYSELDYSILDFIHHPSILFHRNGDVLYINESAKKLIELYDNIQVEKNDLHLDSVEKTNQLKTSVLRASLSKPGDEYRSIITIQSNGYPLALLIMPVSHHRGARLSGAIVYFYDPERSAVVNFDIIALIFNFTKIEVSICEMMILGVSRENIAKELDRSIHTVKDHIKSIYLKVGANSQVDLVGTLLKFPVFPI